VTARYQWNITSLPNKELNNHTTTAIVARIVGGGLALNGMVFDCGSRNDYNAWAEYVGDKGWGWDPMLTYFKRYKPSDPSLSMSSGTEVGDSNQSEKFTPPPKVQQKEWGIQYDPTGHGTDGQVQSSLVPFIYPHFSNLIHIPDLPEYIPFLTKLFLQSISLPLRKLLGYTHHSILPTAKQSVHTRLQILSIPEVTRGHI